MTKKTLDKDLGKISRLEGVMRQQRRGLIPLFVGLLFLVLVSLLAASLVGTGTRGLIVIVAAVIGGYMGLNIGANDVANTMGPVVASRTLTMAAALAIAAVGNVAGAFIAGGNVVSTISKGIIDPALIADPGVFVNAMLAALLASALWVNLATVLSAPVSTTHAIVGGVMGAGIAAAGFAVVNWGTMAQIAASWVVSPLMGGVIAAIIYQAVRQSIFERDDKIAAAVRYVPMFVGIMAGAFAMFLTMKGLGKIWQPPFYVVALIGAALLMITPRLVRPHVVRLASGLGQRSKDVRRLFDIPLICGAGLLAFAHGANDVANAIGPLAAIVSFEGGAEISAKVPVPFWVTAIGGF